MLKIFRVLSLLYQRKLINNENFLIYGNSCGPIMPYSHVGCGLRLSCWAGRRDKSSRKQPWSLWV